MLGRNGALILGEMPTALHVQIVVLAPACIGTAVALFPVALWEFSLGVYLVVKGFKPSPITAGMTASSTRPAYQDAA